MERSVVYDELSDLILSESQRWRDVFFDFMNVNLRSPISIQCSPSLTSLKSPFDCQYLTMDAKIPSLDLSPCTVSINAGAQLQSMEVEFIQSWILPGIREDLYLPSLQELSLCSDINRNVDDIFSILKACPIISTLHIRVRDTFPGIRVTQSDSQTIVLSHLTSLSISSLNHNAAHHILSRLSCPSLQRFVLLSTHCDEARLCSATPQRLRDLAAFFARRVKGPVLPPALTELLLVYPCGTAIVQDERREHSEALRHLLGLLQRLERLNLQGLAITNDLIEDFTAHTDEIQSGNNSALCPFLTTFSIFRDDSDVRKEIMERMIVSRWNSENRLRSMDLEIASLANLPEESEQVKACIAEGLVLHCRSDLFYSSFGLSLEGDRSVE